MSLLRHQLANPKVMQYITRLRNSNGAATFLPTVCAMISKPEFLDFRQKKPWSYVNSSLKQIKHCWDLLNWMMVKGGGGIYRQRRRWWVVSEWQLRWYVSIDSRFTLLFTGVGTRVRWLAYTGRAPNKARFHQPFDKQDALWMGRKCSSTIRRHGGAAVVIIGKTVGCESYPC